MTWTTVEITVAGAVDLDEETLADLSLHGARTQTVLGAQVRDQAALYGLVQHLAALGLDLVGLRTAAGALPEVEVVLRGRVGRLLRAALREADRAEPASATTRVLRTDEVARAVSVLTAFSLPHEGDEAGPASREGGVTGRAGPAPGGRDGREGPVDVTLEEMGPVDWLVVEFKENRLNGEALPLLIELVERGIIRVLDLAFLTKDEAGTVTGVEIRDLDTTGDFDLTVFDGATSGLLDEGDIQQAGAALEPGRAAGIIVYENTWAAPFASAVRRGGGVVVDSGRIPVQSIVAALDAVESR